MSTLRYVEGVPYQRYTVRFRLSDGRVRRWGRWSVATGQYVYAEVGRELADRFGIDGIKPHSCSIVAQ